MSENTVNYKETICLPQTTFPMKGNLVNKEPERLPRVGGEPDLRPDFGEATRGGCGALYSA